MRTGTLDLSLNQESPVGRHRVVNVLRKMRAVDDDNTSAVAEQAPKDLNIDPDRDNERLAFVSMAEKESAHRSAITYLLCGVYALLTIVLGVVFPLSTSLTVSVPGEPKYYLEFVFVIIVAADATSLKWDVPSVAVMLIPVFHLYLYTVSLVFLIYLHCYLLHQKPSRKTPRGNIRLVSNNQLDSPDKSALAVQETSDISSGHSQKEGNRSRTPSDGEVESYHEAPRPVTYDSNGVNFYLRLGAIGFGGGSMILDGFRIAQVFEVDSYWECYGLIAMVLSSAHLIFCFFQTFFLFKNHRIVVNKHKAFVRFGLTHIVATNICIWALETVVETARAYEATQQDTPVVANNVTASPNSTTVAPTVEPELNCYHGETLARKAAPYLFPCTIMYSLIAAAVVYKLYQNVGRVGRHVVSVIHEEERVQRDCHKANKGLFLGLFIAILTLISISCFFVFDRKPDQHMTASMIFYATEATLCFLSLLVVLIGFCKLQTLQFTSGGDAAYKAPLLVIALFGLCIMQVFLIVSSAWAVELPELEGFLIPILSLGTATLQFVQASVQTIFILDGLKRCAESDEQIQSKPGRTLVTFLLLCNLSLWCVATFEAKKTQTVTLHTEYYGYLPWSIISHLCIPLTIFFRFHSSVCLSEIWMTAYTMKKQDV